VQDWLVTAVDKKQATSLGRFDLVAVKDLPVAQGKHITGFNMVDVSGP